jgi:superfamily I DNA/RNA helicase
MKEIKNISTGDICKKSRNFAYQDKMVSTDNPENFARASIIKDTVKAALKYGERNKDHIKAFVESRYDECGFQNPQQRAVSLVNDCKIIMRYITCETRTPIFFDGDMVQMGSHMIFVKPDLAFINGAQLELVIIKIGKPTMAQKNKKGKEDVIKDLKLYSMCLYGRKLGFSNIKASVYFMKKSTDNNKQMYFDPDFFGTGGNVISMEDNHIDGQPDKLDADMQKAVSILECGIDPEKCKKEDCEKCSNYDLCNFSLPPIQIVKEPTVKKIGDISLTPEQQEAINYKKGICRINAGAGAGKTMVTAFRTVQLLNSGVAPDEMLLITFTDAGAKEMRNRIEMYNNDFGTQKNIDGIIISTFNAFGDMIVKDNYQKLGFTKMPKVIDDVERFSIIAKLLSANPIPEWNGDAFLHMNSKISYAKGALQYASDVFTAIKATGKDPNTVIPSDLATTSVASLGVIVLGKLIKLYKTYDQKMKENNLIEFADQEILMFKVIDSDPTYLPTKFKTKHIIVDEFQDSNEGQINLIKCLRQLPTFESLMVVGDDSQAIYSFRSTSPKYIINFEEIMGEHVDDIYLVENHRSTPEIIDFANKINAMNKEKVDKDLIATRASKGVPVSVCGYYDDAEELKAIVEGIKSHIDNGTAPENIAVITYTKFELQKIADLLTKANIPSMMGAPEFVIENSRIRAILAFAKVIDNFNDTKDATICANAMVGGSIMDLPEARVQVLVNDILARASQINMANSLKTKKEMFYSYINAIAMDDETVLSFRDGLDNKEFDELMQYCRDFNIYGGDVQHRRICEYPGVVLTTAHSSKGLEWPIVYNSISKYQRGMSSMMKKEAIEETRRLLFVSATRARDELYITGTFASGKKKNGATIINEFLHDAYDAAGLVYDPSFKDDADDFYNSIV